MVCTFIVMKCKGSSQITDLADYLNNNRLIAHYCCFNIMEPLPSYWTYDRFLRQLDNDELKPVMAGLVRQLYELGVFEASFIGLDFTPVMANTRLNDPKSFVWCCLKELDDELDRDMKDEEKSPPPAFRKSPESAIPVRKWSFL